MRQGNMILVGLLVLGLSVFGSTALIAAEHGGSTVKEHGGQEHGGSAMPEMHVHGSENAAVIREAAAILSATHPDLAAKLEAIAAKEEAEE